MKRPLLLAVLCLLMFTTHRANGQIWPADKANAWYAQKPWPVGCNYGTSTAINQLEMFQADTFDPQQIDKELGWAEGLGFTSIRVFLHDLLWKEDSAGFLKRLDQFVEIADKHHISVMFALFDSVWDPNPQPGKQRAPKPYVHNSGWVQSPGAAILNDAAKRRELEPYVKGVVGHFKNDARVYAWDVINEPDNPNRTAYGTKELRNKADAALELMKLAFGWAREVNPVQPLTSGVWIGTWPDPAKLNATEKFQLENSDVITFHCYGKLDEMTKAVTNLKRYGRPIICTEYMARPRGSTFDPILGYLKDQHVGAYNWGFVSGKTQTIYPWDTWEKQYTAEPKVWFHDIFRQDGTPFDPAEVQYIRKITGAKGS